MSATRIVRLTVGLAGIAALGLVAALAGSPAAASTQAASTQTASTPTASTQAASTQAAVHEHAGHTSSTGRPSAVQVARMRAATAGFHNIANAEDAGYGLLHDLAGLTCIAMPGQGGMGVHFVKGPLVADPGLDIRTPEALVYAPDRDGTLRLAALEFIVDKAAWDAHHSGPPRLFGGTAFDQTAAPNRFGLAPFYSQHVWIWKNNPAGVLAMWNPAVHCPA